MIIRAVPPKNQTKRKPAVIVESKNRTKNNRCSLRDGEPAARLFRENKNRNCGGKKIERREMVLGRRACDDGKKALSKPEAM
jgi:hypothetical protein